jgi:hypothetical protein
MPAPPPLATVVGRHLFYNDSAFDGNDAAPNAGDDGAIATGKAALLPGRAAAFANVTGYTRGINGVMIDVAGGLPLTALAGIAAGVGLKAGTGGDPAAWADAPRPAQVGIRPGAGVGGADRITLVWPDGAIRNTWLRVTVRAAPASGLAADDVFTFGNLVGESGDAAGPLVAGGTDAVGTRRAASVRAVGIGNPYDHNRDGVVNVLDYAAALRNVGKSLVPLPPPVAAQASGPPRLRSIPPRRSILTDAQAPVRTE